LPPERKYEDVPEGRLATLAGAVSDNPSEFRETLLRQVAFNVFEGRRILRYDGGVGVISVS